MVRRVWPFGLMNTLLVLNLAALTVGGAWLWAGLIAALVASTLIDEIAGDEASPPSAVPERLLDAMLYLTLPLMIANSVLLAHLVGTADPLGLVGALAMVGVDLDAARAATGPLHLVGAVLALGLFTGAAATNVAHELVHRTESPLALGVGRWLLAFSIDTTFAIEHVHGHHRHVATARDPATARRGETAFAFALRSTIDGNRSAWAIERDRLERKGLPVWSWPNRVLTGQLLSLAIAALWMLIAGLAGLAVFLISAVQGKLYLELVNYIEHYGLVRVPGTSVEPRHSWNAYRRVTNGLLYNLARHSHHHRFARKPFWQLEVEPGAPTLPHGYMTMILIALVPPLFERTMAPLLATWDREQATPEERALI
jgi:alkane 1-monooxygenase